MAINAVAPAGGGADTTYAAAVIKQAWDQHFRGALRHQTLWRNLFDVRPIQVTNPGQTVTLFKNKDLTKIASEDPTSGGALLTDATDPTPLTYPTPDTVDLVARSYGRVVVRTELLELFSLNNVNQYEAEQVAWDMENTLDLYCRFVANGGTNVAFSGDATTTASVNAGDNAKISDFEKIVARLRTAAVMPKRGDLYAAYIHPHVSLDLRQDTGAAGWLLPHQYSAPNLIWKGEVGIHGGAFFVETGRAKVAQDGVDATPDHWVYRSIVAGSQALAEGVALEPQLVFNGNTGADLLNRFYTLGWKFVGGWARFREEALYRLESASTLNGAGVNNP